MFGNSELVICMQCPHGLPVIDENKEANAMLINIMVTSAHINKWRTMLMKQRGAMSTSHMKMTCISLSSLVLGPCVWTCTHHSEWGRLI